MQFVPKGALEYMKRAIHAKRGGQHLRIAQLGRFCVTEHEGADEVWESMESFESMATKTAFEIGEFHKMCRVSYACPKTGTLNSCKVGIMPPYKHST